MHETDKLTFRTKIRRRLKKIFDNEGNDKLKLNFLRAVPFWIASLLTGLIAVFYSKVFLLAESSTGLLFKSFHWLLFVITPACFLTAWWLVVRYEKFAGGSGIPQVMAAIELANPRDHIKVRRLLSIRVIIIKIISSLFMVLGGGVVGREGPTIQIAGSVFRKVNQVLPEWWPKVSRRNMIMTGAAAGLAAAFNTPLGGIVFAIEELTKTHFSYFRTALFTAVIIAGLTAQALFGPYLYLGYPSIGGLSVYIFLGVILVAMLAGLGGSVTGRILIIIINWKGSLKKIKQQVLFVFICGLIVAFLGFISGTELIGSGKTIMTEILFTSNKYLPWYAPFIRMTGSIFSFSTGAAGGIFAPALSSGACIGSVLSGWMNLTDSNTNLLILSGMVGFLTGITRTPFTSSIIVLEMTDRHNLIFYLMLAGMVAGMVSLLIDKHSLYDHLKVRYLKDIALESQRMKDL
ncbi:MAG TPA: chloride channel protein [Puia sp.]